MKYLFGEDRLVFERKPDVPDGPRLRQQAETEKTPEQEREAVARRAEEAKAQVTGAARSALKELDPMKDLTQKKVEKAFTFTEKEKFDEKKIEEMLAVSESMSVYDLWRGGVARMKNENNLKENQGFDRMAAQFAKREVDDKGRGYLNINLKGKDKFEMNIGAGHICPPSWKKVAIVDRNGNMKVGERKVPGKDNVDGNKVGYYDDKGEYLVVFSGYKVYPLEILSEEEVSDKKVVDEQAEKENKFYVENKNKLMEYVVEPGSYSVRQAEMSKAEIQRIRDKIPGLEDIQDPGERVAAVAKYITENEKIYAKHCGNWVDRVYAIAGVQGKRDLFRNLDYAKGPDGKLGASRDAREGVHAIKQRPNLVNNLKPGTWLWINNRNSFDIAGNHSVIFIEWVDRARRIARCAEHANSRPDGQKISNYNFGPNGIPIVSMTIPTAVEKKFERLSPEEMAREEELAGRRRSERRTSAGRTSTAEAYESAKQVLSGSDKSKLAEEGRTPFPVRVGYELTPEETAIYNRERAEGHRLARMRMGDRLEIMQQRYRLKDAIEQSFRALRMQERHRAYFYAYNDAIMRVESNYNPICINRRNGRVALSTASGAYQILNSTWSDMSNRWLRDNPEANGRRRSYNSRMPEQYKIDFDLLKDVDFNASLPGLLTPYEHAIFHNLYAFMYSRTLRGVIPFDAVFDKLQSGSLSPEMQYSHQAYLYTNWRNGHGGAKVFLQMMNRGIPFPQNESQAREYFEQMPNCWQKRRGFNDFRTLVRACGVFVRRFNENLREQGAA